MPVDTRRALAPMPQAAQVHHQQTWVEVQQQVLAASRDIGDDPTSHHRWRAAQRPPQGLAHPKVHDRGPLDGIGKASTRDFDFWKFGHG